MWISWCASHQFFLWVHELKLQAHKVMYCNQQKWIPLLARDCCTSISVVHLFLQMRYFDNCTCRYKIYCWFSSLEDTSLLKFTICPHPVLVKNNFFKLNIVKGLWSMLFLYSFHSLKNFHCTSNCCKNGQSQCSLLW